MRSIRSRSLALAALALCLGLTVIGQGLEDIIVARLTVKNEAETRRAMSLGLDLMEYREGNDLIFWTTKEQLNELSAHGWEVSVDEKLTAELSAVDVTETFNGGYRTVEETRTFLDQRAAQYPNLARVFTYGQSWEKLQNAANGYHLFGISLTNSAIRGDKPRFFLEAGIHARELVPPEVATRFIDYLLTNYGIDADATWLLDEHEIIVIPIVNPDGRKLAEQSMSKRKNMNNSTGNCTTVSRGVDLNRNFSYLWGTVNLPTEPPCGETFPGLSAASEPEAYVIENLLDSLYPDQRGPGQSTPASPNATGIFLDMHSTGNLVLYPWGQNETPPPNIQLKTIAERMAGFNGYNPIQSVILYPTSGTAREYAYGELGVAGLAMEIGLGSGTCGGFMPAYTCIDGGGTSGNFWNKNRPVLLYLAKIARTPYMTADGPTTETLSVTRTGSKTFLLRALVNDGFNGEQLVNGAEVYIDVPPWRGGVPLAMSAEDGSFNSTTEMVTRTVTVSAGRHIIYVRGRDANGNWGAVTAAFLPSRFAGTTQTAQ
jgi:predicted deacylase